MNETEQYRIICMEYEKKLCELMGEDVFQKYAVDVARRLFRKEIDGMAEGEFKRFVTENFDVITA